MTPCACSCHRRRPGVLLGRKREVDGPRSPGVPAQTQPRAGRANPGAPAPCSDAPQALHRRGERRGLRRRPRPGVRRGLSHRRGDGAFLRGLRAPRPGARRWRRVALAAIVGLTNALDLVLSGEPIDAATAFGSAGEPRGARRGADRGRRGVRARFALSAPRGVEVAKRALYRGLEMSLDTALDSSGRRSPRCARPPTTRRACARSASAACRGSKGADPPAETSEAAAPRDRPPASARAAGRRRRGQRPRAVAGRDLLDRQRPVRPRSGSSCRRPPSRPGAWNSLIW